MILYDTGKWFDSIYLFNGTVWPHIRTKLVLATIYSWAAYIYATMYKVNFGSEGRTILFGTMSFLLVFRANQAYARYWEGRTLISQLFSDLRKLIATTVIFLRGGASSACAAVSGLGASRPMQIEDAHDLKAREVRVDIARLVIALAVAFQAHTHICLDGYCFGEINRGTRWRIDWDRLRLRQLLADEEFQFVDGCFGYGEERHPKKVLMMLVKQFAGSIGQQGPQDPPDDWPESTPVNGEMGVRPYSVIIFFIRELLSSIKHQEVTIPWGLKERFSVDLTELLGKIEHHIAKVEIIITTPVPLPYANLCRTLLLIFCFTLPFFVDVDLGWFANTVIPSAITLALLGVDAIATELENPFGEDPNDLDILELIATLEKEVVDILTIGGDLEARRRFCWRRVPAFVRKSSPKPIVHQLVWVDVCAPEIVMPEVDPSLDALGAIEDEQVSIVEQLSPTSDSS